MSELTERFSYRRLKCFYKRNVKLFRRSPASGVDGEYFDAFNRQCDERLRSISKTICSGDYRQRQLKPVPMDKADGGVRWICIPTISDRLVQRVIVDAVVSLYGERLNTKRSFGSLKNVEQNGEPSATELGAQLRNDHPWCVKTDISAFFDSIDRRALQQRVRKVVRHRSLYRPIFEAIGNEAKFQDARAEAEFSKSGMRNGKGLRQGMPLSPLLAHLYLVDFDRWTDTLPVAVLRYVDDLLILGNSREEVVSAFASIKNQLQHLGLDVHELGKSKKTEIISPNQPVSFLGVEIYQRKAGGYGRRIPAIVRERLTERVADRLDIAPDKLPRNYILRSAQYIASLRRNYRTVYRDMDNMKDFEKLLIEQETRAMKLFRKTVAEMKPKDIHTQEAFGLR